MYNLLKPGCAHLIPVVVSHASVFASLCKVTGRSASESGFTPKDAVLGIRGVFADLS